jgi:hypothetical protein
VTGAVRSIAARVDTNRLLRPVVAVLAVAAGYFGVFPYLLPERGAELSGLTGQDVFFYRLTGAASFGYAVALLVGMRGGWRGLRIPMASMATFAVGSIVGCLVNIVFGGATWITWLVLIATSVFLVLQLLLLANPPAIGHGVGSGEPDIADWYRWLVGIGALAALGTGSLGLLLGGTLGRLFGYDGADDFVYRQMGAAILGYALGGVLALRSGRWVELRGSAWGALAFNGLSAIATVVELTRPGGVNLWSLVVLLVSVGVTGGLIVAIRRGGR